MNLPVCLFVSPHLDDVALSCGGYVHRLAQVGCRVVVATVVTADAPAEQPLSPLALRCLRQWNLWDAPFAARREEDRRAMQVLGAEAVHLGLLDAIHRRGADGRAYYPQRILDQVIPPEDWADFGARVEQCLAELMAQPGKRPDYLFLPLGLAGHVDHVIVRQVADRLARDMRTVYYEEYPYAALAGAQRPPADWRSITVSLSPHEIEARLQAVACYASAIAFLFPSRLQTALEILHARLPGLARVPAWRPARQRSLSRMQAALRTYIARAGGERYWFAPDSPERLPL